MQPFRKLNRPGLLVIAGIGLFLIWFGLQAWFRHANFYTSQYDLGNMDNVLWHVWHGHGFVMTDPTKLIQVPRTSFHTDWLMLAGMPFYALWPDPRVLMWLQVLVVATGAIPIYLLAKKKITPAWGAGLAWLYLLYPPLAWSTMFDFHSVTLATALLLWAVWAWEQRRYWLFGTMLALALLAKEELGILVGLLGLVLTVKRRPRWIGLVTAGVGFGWSGLMLGLVIPSARVSDLHFASGWFAEYGDSPKEIVTHLIRHPGSVWNTLTNIVAGQYYGMLLWPVGFIALLGWPWLLVAVPIVVINLLSSNPNLRAIFFHYTSAITPFIFLATITGLAWLKQKHTRWIRWQRWMFGWMVVNVAISVWIWAPLPGMHNHLDAIRVFRGAPERAAVANAKQQISATATVSATNNLGAHFSQRHLIFAFPHGLDRADVAVILLSDGVEAVSQDELRAAIRQLEVHSSWNLKLHQGNFWYFERIQALAQE